MAHSSVNIIFADMMDALGVSSTEEVCQIFDTLLKDDQTEDVTQLLEGIDFDTEIEEGNNDIDVVSQEAQNSTRHILEPFTSTEKKEPPMHSAQIIDQPYGTMDQIMEEIDRGERQHTIMTTEEMDSFIKDLFSSEVCIL